MSKRKYEWRYDFLNESRRDKTDWSLIIFSGVLLSLLFMFLFILARAIINA